MPEKQEIAVNNRNENIFVSGSFHKKLPAEMAEVAVSLKLPTSTFLFAAKRQVPEPLINKFISSSFDCRMALFYHSLVVPFRYACEGSNDFEMYRSKRF